MAQQSFPPTQIRLAPVADFTGGLNLRADAFKLAANESPDLLDMEVGIDGGFVQRRVVAPWGGTGLTGLVINLFAFNTTGGTSQVVAQCSNGAILYSTGSTWASIYTLVGATSTKVRGAVFNDVLYLVHGSVDFVGTWDGSAHRGLTQTFNNTIGGEGAHDGNMPYAKLITVHESRVFIAYTTESGVDFPNRIRWSHPGFAEDWRAQDFIDIDVGHDGDVITAIVPFRGRLYIFKNQSIYELVGFGPENFQIVPITTDIGCVGQEATKLTEVGLFFFSYPQGVYLDKGSGPYPIFDKLWPMIRDDFIPQSQVNTIAMGWINRNLWMSIPFQGPSTLPPPNIVSVAQIGTPGTTTYGYVVTAINASGETLGSMEVKTTTGAATLNTANYNVITWTAVAGATGYKVYGRTVGAETLLSGLLGTSAIYNDQGATPSGSALPTANTAAVGSAPRTLIYNPWIWRQRYMRFLQGPWYPYSLGVSAFLEKEQPGGALLHLAASNQVAAVGQVEVNGQQDQWHPNATPTAVPSYFTTRWMDVGSPSILKRWRHPDFVMRAGTTGAVRVDIHKNYDPSQLYKTYYVQQTTDSTTLVWDDGSGTLGGKWDDGSGTVGKNWAGLPNTQELVIRGSSMGSGRAVQMTFTGPANAAWGVDAIVLKFILKRVRG